MGKKKSNSANAVRALESTISPIVEINYKDPLFAVAAHPTKPILLQGLATGHVFCTSYDDVKLEEAQVHKREENELLEKEAFAKGKISAINKSVSQTKKKWWTVVPDNSEMDSPLISNMWKTKRHKGSCRSVLFDPLENSVGENIFTVGTDHIIKKAATETGKVLSKTVVDFGGKAADAITKLCHSTSHPFLLAGTENGNVLVYDSSNLSNKLKFRVDKVHDDAVNHILPMPEVSAYHYLSLGSTTLSHIDIRKGIITQSDDQEDELLSMCYATDQSTQAKNDTVLVSHGEGIVTIWKNSKNRLMDQLSRIKVNHSASIDAIIPTMNQDDDEMAASVWCGDSEGLLHRVNYKKGKVVETRVHSTTTKNYGAADEVGVLDIDFDYRLISAGMDSLKIWSNEDRSADGEDNEDDWEDENGSDSDSDREGAGIEDDSSDLDSDLGPSDFSSDSDENEGEEVDDNSEGEGAGDSDGADIDVDDVSDEERQEEEKEEKEVKMPQLVRKKRLNFSLESSRPKPKKKIIDFNKTIPNKEEKEEESKDEPAAKKLKTKQMTTKQIRNLQKHEHGIRKFDDL
ncbi:WD repeat-containing protein Jip5p [[Candida] railenensis]|uniref:WD repeat-containing protein JIP5 n=1 Tax=[Candida] railenensis TaxID=45579 RepID=A0A9P0QLJ9_9ASCO|nr:WD repeat-containing protein Jip5p [[Candida] railenensis]